MLLVGILCFATLSVKEIAGNGQLCSGKFTVGFAFNFTSQISEGLRWVENVCVEGQRLFFGPASTWQLVRYF